MNASDWVFERKLYSNAQTPAFPNKMVGFRWNDDNQLSRIDIGVDLLSRMKVVF